MTQRDEPQILADLIRMADRYERDAEFFQATTMRHDPERAQTLRDDAELIEQARAALHRHVVRAGKRQMQRKPLWQSPIEIFRKRVQTAEAFLTDEERDGIAALARLPTERREQRRDGDWLERRGKDLQRQIPAVANRWMSGEIPGDIGIEVRAFDPLYSRMHDREAPRQTDGMLESAARFLAPDWDAELHAAIGGMPLIMLTRYRGYDPEST